MVLQLFREVVANQARDLFGDVLGNQLLFERLENVLQVSFAYLCSLRKQLRNPRKEPFLLFLLRVREKDKGVLQLLLFLFRRHEHLLELLDVFLGLGGLGEVQRLLGLLEVLLGGNERIPRGFRFFLSLGLVLFFLGSVLHPFLLLLWSLLLTSEVGLLEEDVEVLHDEVFVLTDVGDILVVSEEILEVLLLEHFDEVAEEAGEVGLRGDFRVHDEVEDLERLVDAELDDFLLDFDGHCGSFFLLNDDLLDEFVDYFVDLGLMLGGYEQFLEEDHSSQLKYA